MTQPNTPGRRRFWGSRWFVGVAAFVAGAVLASAANGSATQTNTAGAPKPTATASITATPKPTPTPTVSEQTSREHATGAPTRKPVNPSPKTYLVTRVIDGDTIELANGEAVRVVGIDTPERGDCGYDQATANMARLVLAKRVQLVISDEDRDHYGRLLRYVDRGRMDAGLKQIKAGLAIARYDSRDGYGYHPREDRYIAADKATPSNTCPRPAPPANQPAPAAGCDPGYDPCVPPYPPDLDCADVNGPIRVTGSDPHGFDRDGDGLACE